MLGPGLVAGDQNQQNGSDRHGDAPGHYHYHPAVGAVRHPPGHQRKQQHGSPAKGEEQGNLEGGAADVQHQQRHHHRLHPTARIVRPSPQAIAAGSQRCRERQGWTQSGQVSGRRSFGEDNPGGARQRGQNDAPPHFSQYHYGLRRFPILIRLKSGPRYTGTVKQPKGEAGVGASPTSPIRSSVRRRSGIRWSQVLPLTLPRHLRRVRPAALSDASPAERRASELSGGIAPGQCSSRPQCWRQRVPPVALPPRPRRLILQCSGPARPRIRPSLRDRPQS